MALRLFVIRHGETDCSRERRFAGRLDVVLSERGRRQSEAVAAALAERPLGAVYASPAACARAAAEAVAAPHGVAVMVEPAFAEMAFGEWEGLSETEWSARFPAAGEAWTREPHLVTPPAGERLDAVAARVGRGVGELRAAHAGQTVALVTHAIVTRLIVLDALGLGLDRLWCVDASPAGITEIEYERAEADGGRGWTVVHRMNTVSHLETVAVEALAS